jgi:fumarylacetoacetase-like protein
MRRPSDREISGGLEQLDRETGGVVGPGHTPRYRRGSESSRAETLGFFLKATGSISGPLDPIALPVRDYPDRRFDHEGEIAFVVGRTARGVTPEQAVDYIFGYTIVVDATLRGRRLHDREPPGRGSHRPRRHGCRGVARDRPYEPQRRGAGLVGHRRRKVPWSLA